MKRTLVPRRAGQWRTSPAERFCLIGATGFEQATARPRADLALTAVPRDDVPPPTYGSNLTGKQGASLEVLNRAYRRAIGISRARVRAWRGAYPCSLFTLLTVPSRIAVILRLAPRSCPSSAP